MTDSTPSPVPAPKRSRLRRALRWALALVALSTVPISCELLRWQPLPTGPLPSATFGPRASDAAGRLAAEEVAAWSETRPVTGLAVCVASKGQTLWCSSTGYADLDSRSRFEPTTSTRIGSVSKTVTAILLARLVEQGRVDLDQPIGEIDRSLPEHLAPLTLRQLASHRAGIRHYRWRFSWPPHESWTRRPYDSVRESLAVFADDELVYEPETDFLYSTHGYTLLGAVLEQATGRSFEDLLTAEIVDPLDLASTALETSTGGDPGQARPYEVVGRRARHAMVVDNSRMWPGGGVRSSAADLARLASGLPEGLGVRADTLEHFLEPQLLANGDDNPQRYALGWRIGRTSTFLGGEESYLVAHHGGVASGGSAFLVLFPEHSFAAAVVTNTRTGSGALQDVAFGAAEPFMAEVVASADEPVTD